MSTLSQLETGIGAPFLVCSTGRIGRQLPMDKIKAGIASRRPRLLSADTQASLDAADAILTSDTRRKVATARFDYQGKTITVSGMAKGAGMIEPNMATMLAFVATDLEADSAFAQNRAQRGQRQDLQSDLDRRRHEHQRHRATLRQRRSPAFKPRQRPELLAAFKDAVYQVCDEPRRKDRRRWREGHQASGADRRRLPDPTPTPKKSPARWAIRCWSRPLGTAPTRTGDGSQMPRAMHASGSKEASFDIHYDDVAALISGKPQDSNLPQWKAIVAKKRFRITLNLNQGDGHYRLLTSDLSEAYVDFNKSE